MNRRWSAWVAAFFLTLPCSSGATADDPWLASADEFLAQQNRPSLNSMHRIPAPGSVAPKWTLQTLIENLPTESARLAVIQSGLEAKIAGEGAKSGHWRMLRLAVLTVTQPTPVALATAKADLAAADASGVDFGRAAETLAAVVAQVEGAQLGGDAAGSFQKFQKQLQLATEQYESQLRARQPVTHQAAALSAGGDAQLARAERLIHQQVKVLAKFQAKQRQSETKYGGREPTEAERKELIEQYKQAQAAAEAWFKGLPAADQTFLNSLEQKPDVVRYLMEKGRPQVKRAYAKLPVFFQSVSVPDLVTLIGEEEARVQLRKALEAPVMLRLERGAQTRRLLAELALQQIDSLRLPQFSLVDSIDQGPLFEALARRFPEGFSKQGRHDQFAYERESATSHYRAWLLQEGRLKEALSVTGSKQAWNGPLNSDDLRELIARGKSAQVFDFLMAVVEKNPDQELWVNLESLAAQSGRSEALLQLAQRVASRSDLGAEAIATAQLRLARAQLAAEKVNEAAEKLGQLGTPGTGSPELRRTRTNAAALLARLGRVLAQAGWEQAGRESLVRLAQLELAESKSDVHEPYDALEALEASKRPGEIIALSELYLAASDRARAESEKAGPGPRRSDFWANRGDRSALTRLVVALVEMGDYAGALARVREDPRWEAENLGRLLADNTPDLGVAVAQALRATGDHALARRVIEATIEGARGSDKAYAFLNEMAGAEMIPFLDALAAEDIFEERPLIWKAQALLNLGRYEEAEAAVQQAIHIDPSDGEQGPPDRMRAYAVLAEILRRTGRAEKAAFFDGVVRAIRKSEHADEFRQASLQARAIALYRESLGDFADAYCIQSRLARTLYEQGRTEEAAQHYRRAFELMPDSFGRMESHCFGCEHAFEGEGPQRIAEEVFTAAIARDPTKPQAHYLLGYLRYEQQRYKEAWKHFRRAVELDPKYLSAWTKLADTAARISVPAAERDDALLEPMMLSPWHGGANFEEVTDHLRGWKLAREASELRAGRRSTAVLLPMNGKSVASRDSSDPREAVWRLPLLTVLDELLAQNVPD